MSIILVTLLLGVLSNVCAANFAAINGNAGFAIGFALLAVTYAVLAIL